MKNTITLTVAIPAYNEQDNIGILLTSVLNQRLRGIKLKNILIVSDGSTDKTVRVVKEFTRNHKVIRLINHHQRSGKVHRLNEIYRLNDSDYLVVLDADLLVKGNNFLSQLVCEMEANKSISMTAAHQIPTRANGIVARSIYAAYKVWDDTRLAVPAQNHIQNFYGAATIYRASFVSQLRIPSQVTDERGYIYLRALEVGLFHYTFAAAVYYRPVETLHDLWKLGDRSFSKNQLVLAKIFGERVEIAYRIPTKYKVKSIISNLLHNPIYTTLGLLLNILIRLFPLHDHLYDMGMWEPSRSTKKAIKV